MPKDAFLLIEEDGQYSGIPEKVLLYINPKSKFRDGFCLSWSHGLMKLSDMDLTASQYRILLIIIAELEYENICYVPQSYITEKSGISQPNVSKHIAVLMKRNLIFKEVIKGRKAFRVHCHIAWKGTKSKAFNMAFEKDSQYELQ